MVRIRDLVKIGGLLTLISIGVKGKELENVVELGGKYRNDKVTVETLVHENDQVNQKQAEVHYTGGKLSFGTGFAFGQYKVSEGNKIEPKADIKIGNKTFNAQGFFEYSFSKSKQEASESIQNTFEAIGKANLRLKKNKLNVSYLGDWNRSEKRDSLPFLRRSFCKLTNDGINLNHEFLTGGVDIITTINSQYRKLNFNSRKKEYLDINPSLDMYFSFNKKVNIEALVDYRNRDREQELNIGSSVEIGNLGDWIFLRGRSDFTLLNEQERAGLGLDLALGRDAILIAGLDRMMKRELVEYRALGSKGYEMQAKIRERYEEKKAKLDIPLLVSAYIAKPFDRNRDEFDLDLTAGFKPFKVIGVIGRNTENDIESMSLGAGFYLNVGEILLKGIYERVNYSYGEDLFGLSDILPDARNIISVKATYGGESE
jgi:hypothetical protein